MQRMYYVGSQQGGPVGSFIPPPSTVAPSSAAPPPPFPVPAPPSSGPYYASMHAPSMLMPTMALSPSHMLFYDDSFDPLLGAPPFGAPMLARMPPMMQSYPHPGMHMPYLPGMATAAMQPGAQYFHDAAAHAGTKRPMVDMSSASTMDDGSSHYLTSAASMASYGSAPLRQRRRSGPKSRASTEGPSPQMPAAFDAVVAAAAQSTAAGLEMDRSAAAAAMPAFSRTAGVDIRRRRGSGSARTYLGKSTMKSLMSLGLSPTEAVQQGMAVGSSRSKAGSVGPSLLLAADEALRVDTAASHAASIAAQEVDVDVLSPQQAAVTAPVAASVPVAHVQNDPVERRPRTGSSSLVDDSADVWNDVAGESADL